MSNNSPMKKVNAGLISIADCCLLIADCRSWRSSANQRLHYSNTPSLRWFRDTRDGRLFHLDLHVIGNFYDHGGIFHIGNKTVNAGTGYDAIAGFERTDYFLLFFLPAPLRTNPNKIEDDQDKDERDEKIESATGTGGAPGRAGLRLS